MSLPKVRTRKEYQEFVKEQLKARSLGIPTFFMNVYAKLINLDLSRVNSILKFRYSNRGTPARRGGIPCFNFFLRKTLLKVRKNNF